MVTAHIRFITELQGNNLLRYVFGTFYLLHITLNVSHFKVQIGFYYRPARPWTILNYFVSFVLKEKQQIEVYLLDFFHLAFS